MLSRWCDFTLDPAVRRLFPLVGVGTDRAALADIDAAIAKGLARVESALTAGTTMRSPMSPASRIAGSRQCWRG